MWDLFLESMKDFTPYTLTYDHNKYSRYLTFMLGEMLILELV